MAALPSGVTVSSAPISGVGHFHFAPLTLSVSYDDSGGTMEIGGATCHLCGAKLEAKNVYGSRRRKYDEWTERKYIRYACGTYMYVKASGKKKITLGADCVCIIAED